MRSSGGGGSGAASSTPALLLAAAAACAASFTAGAALATLYHSSRRRETDDDATYLIAPDLPSLVGSTPLLRVGSLSDATGCDILVKCEFLNPGGSVKDRVAKAVLELALKGGTLAPGGLVTEGTAGSTGVALATLAPAYGLSAAVWLPDDAAPEKAALLASLAARVTRVRPVPIAHPGHFVHAARAGAADATERLGFPTSLFSDQFESPASAAVHASTTGPEIWRGTAGRIDAFVCGAGTGGTLAGVGAALRAKKPSVRLVLADPPGSALAAAVTRGVAHGCHDAEGRRRTHQVDTVTEGVGLNRLTPAFRRVLPSLDGVVEVSDAAAIEMSRFVLAHDGLFLGSSSALNLCGAVATARALGPGHTVVTLACDGGERHTSKFWSQAFLDGCGLGGAARGPVRGRGDVRFVG
jgi:cysteine synthase A